jgi:hypothetical protein
MIGRDHQQQPGRTWKVGALAKATGLTVRTLHHYDEIGLLAPSTQLAGGHRLYDADDVAGCTGSSGCVSLASRSVR